MKTTESGDKSDFGFRSYLQHELAQRCLNNPKYSLRAFAQSLEIDHSTLSQLLRGKRRFTTDTIRKLSHLLGIPKREVEGFVTCEKHLGFRETLNRQAEQLRQESMEVISQWQHFAILELTHLNCFQPDCKWIARVLDIPVDDVNLAITRLLHLDLLRMAGRNKWIDCSDNAVARFEELPIKVARHVMDRLAQHAGTNPSSCGQRLSSSTFAVDRTRLAVLSRYLERVRQDITELVAGQQSACNDVFQLDIFLYPLTKLYEEHHSNGTGSNPISNHRQGPEQVG